jgi:hypothetical protein
MSYNGSGTFQINSAGQPVVAGTVITAAAFNALTADLATGLSTAMTKDGQTTATANIPMGNNKFTGVAAGTAGTDSVNLAQVQGNVASLISVSGIDTITGSMSPTLTAYSTGAMYWFVASGTNTGAVTMNIDALGAKAVTRDGSTALIAGDIVSGQVAVIVYDGTRFQLQKANAFGTLTATTINTTNLTATGTVNLTGATVSNGGSVTTIDINGGTVDGVTIGGAAAGAGTFTNLTASGTVNFTGATVSNLGSVTTADINGGTVDGVTIGGASAGAATFTNLTASGTINFTGATVSNGGSVTTIDINGGTIDGAVIGGASAAAGTFTTATVGAGTVGAPSLTTTGDTNTGIWFPAADTLAASTGGSERMRIDSSGNVGIGTTSPGSLLQLNKGSGAADLRFSVAGTLYGNLYASSSDTSLFAVTSIPLLFGTNNTERMRIDSSGNVGIGTSSPNNRFHVKGPWTTNEGQFQIDADSGQQFSGLTIQNNGTYKTIFYNDNTNAWTFLSTASGSNQSLLLGTNETERMRLDSSGNVRIGTAALATTATDGFLYIPTCAGTPTGTPTAITGLAPLVINTTNNKLYFYSGGAWRDAGP